MGAWGSEPWDNDTASDWFAELMDATNLAEQVVEGLNEDVEDEPEIVRAAAYVVLALGRVYIWPIDKLNDHVKLAADRLQAILDAETHVSEDEEAVEQIKKEIAELRSRVSD